MYRLHENLIEHLASEICLGTIMDETSALKWYTIISWGVNVLTDSIFFLQKVTLNFSIRSYEAKSNSLQNEP